MTKGDIVRHTETAMLGIVLGSLSRDGSIKSDKMRLARLSYVFWIGSGRQSIVRDGLLQCVPLEALNA